MKTVRFLTTSLFFLLFSLCLQASQETHYLRDSLSLAQKGDFIVTLQGKMHTLLHIHSIAYPKMVIEEISVPKHAIPHYPFSWKQWVHDQAPHHTAWSMYEIDLESGDLLEFYSFSEKGWAELSSGNHFLSTMLFLQLHKVKSWDRKRVGPTPNPGEMDRRRTWHPRLTVEGEVVPGLEFNAWRTYWPKDGSELSGKLIDLYLPKDSNSPLAYFPAWLEVSGTIGRAQLRIIDSGKGLSSPYTTLPRRPPTLIGDGELDEKGLSLKIKSGSSPQPYRVFAAQNTPHNRLFIELDSLAQHHPSTSTLTLHIPIEELRRQLTPGTSYQFVVQPLHNPAIYTETAHPLLWSHPPINAT